MYVRKTRRCCAAVVALLALPLTAAFAQDSRSAAPPRGSLGITTGDPARRDVRVPDNVTNISGSWVARSSNRTIMPLDGGPSPFLPWAAAFFDERAAAEKAGTPFFDTNASCLPSGVPRVLAVPYPIDIVQTPTLTVISIEVMHSFRIIHMDDKPPPADYKPSYLGYSRGHWEGDTLVVTTTGLNAYTQVDEEGRPKSSSMKVTERIRKVAPDFLENTFTIDDPNTYSRPWTARSRYQWAPDYRLAEYICEENNRNKPDATGKLRHGQGGDYAERKRAKKK
jgi:hypothetical protein